MRITAACPENMLFDANQLAMCLAFSEADANTYQGLNWKDSGGNLYAAASFEVQDVWLELAQSELVRPDWDTNEIIDMGAATRAQSALVFSLEPIEASTTTLTAIGGMNGTDAIQAMNLTSADAMEE